MQSSQCIAGSQKSFTKLKLEKSKVHTGPFLETFLGGRRVYNFWTQTGVIAMIEEYV